MNVLYITNTEVPYRVRFFNELSKHIELTVLYERKGSSNRNKEWAQSENIRYKAKYLNGIKIKNENSFSLGILSALSKKYDTVVIGCVNSPVQMFLMLIMRLLGRKFVLNLDGEIFLGTGGIKNRLKRFFLSSAYAYLVAGFNAAASLEQLGFTNGKKGKECKKPIFPYPFSSLSKAELEKNASVKTVRGEKILVVGQYFDYKGLDIALAAAKADSAGEYIFVGMGSRTELFISEQNAGTATNVEVIPFLQKDELYKLYGSCAMLVLPSLQECWGLVVNEAASFGTPIVSTLGSGSAVEFLKEKYPHCLAKSGDSEALLCAINTLRNTSREELNKYSVFLKEKTQEYSIENCVAAHVEAFNALNKNKED